MSHVKSSKTFHLLALRFFLILCFLPFSLFASGKADNKTGSSVPEYRREIFDLSFVDLLSGRELSTISGDESRRGTLVVFWSIDCNICVHEVPTINALYSQWQPRGLEIIGIPAENQPERILSFAQQMDIEWPQNMESGQGFNKASFTAWGVIQTPTFFLLDREGRILESGFTDPASALNRYF